jgi:hypothetical protein
MRLVMNVSDRIHVLTDGHTLAGDAVAEVRAIKAVVEAISAFTTPAWRRSWSIRSWNSCAGSSATQSPSYRWTRMPRTALARRCMSSRPVITAAGSAAALTADDWSEPATSASRRPPVI